MKTRRTCVLIVLCALSLEPIAFAGRGGGHHGGGGGHRGGGGAQKISRPSGGSADFRPSGGSHRPQVSRPSTGGSRVPASRPAQRPAAKPQRPSGSAGTPNFGGDRQRPQTRPPQVPKPQGGGDFIGMRSDRPASRPDTSNRPDIANRPGLADRDRPGIANRPGLPNIENRPGLGDNLPNFDSRPGRPARPERPNRPDHWQNIQNNNDNQWNRWRQNNSTRINNFQINRTNNWNRINARYKERGWAGRYGSPDYLRWRGDVRNFRIGRGWEIWGQRRPLWNTCFDNHWWASCWWRPRPIMPISVAVSPWWWWRPFVWPSVGVFFGASIASQPIIYDPGTTAIYEGDTYFVDGQPVSSATEAREAASKLADPEVAETPVPEPAMEGQPEEWLPVSVWALTQQEQGDATMFVQLSIDKNGIVGGAYKNVMTGDEQPIIGQLDARTQRVAWHVGDATQTVYETGLSNLQNDVASVFVHFGKDMTQTWLLVRLPSPELPPGSVKLPEVAQQ
ncbi:MAG: hypothetical protein WBW78_01415 [Terrimicrobiaceae bacterium]